MSKFIAFTAAALLALSAVSANAADKPSKAPALAPAATSTVAVKAKPVQCRDDKGKFIKCAAPVAMAGARCRDKTTMKFAKCDAPNTEAVSIKK